MKKRIIYVILLAIVFSSLPEFTFAADSTTASIAIPISSGLTGSDNSAKTFSLDLPSTVTSSSILASTLKYNGNNAIVGNLSVVEGKVKLTLKGNQSVKTIDVQGYRGSHEAIYTSNIYNSIWLYSDGRRWQINEYDEKNDINNAHRDVQATDGVPSKNPPSTLVSAGPLQDRAYLKWYNGSKTEVIDSDAVVQSTIIPQIISYSNYVKNEPKFKNNRVILNYWIPNSVKYAPESTEGLSGVAEGRRYFATVNYYYTATAKVTTYSYAGTVTFEYKLPTEPTLTGEVGLLAPNPNPEKYSDKAVPVKLSLKGSLAAYTDTSNILEWVFYAKKTGNDGSLVTKKDTKKVLSSDQQFDFEISKQEAATQPKFTQNYTLTVTVRFAKPVVTASGSISTLSETFTINAGTYNGPPPSSIPIPTPTPAIGKPPIARITMPDQVVAGEKFIVSGAESFDPDGTILTYSWQHPNVNLALYGKSSDTSYGLDSIDTTQTITLTVTDNDGLTSTTTRDIKVVAPAPKAKIELLGTLKQNRKITIRNGTKNISDDFPIVESSTRFTITAVSGGSNADIKYSGSLVGVKEVDVLMKTPGQYKATLYVVNTAGYSGTSSWTFTVAPDEAPVPYISMPLIVYRDPDNGNKASVTLEDFTVSPDYDYLATRVWEYRYDSDNNGNFTGEAWTQLSNANLDRINFYPAKVGRYEIRLTVTEEFGQPTIDAFVTASDRRSANTDTQPVLERIVTVENRPPTSDWSW
ncbi:MULTISPECIES: hypothetical protein [unclassified Paenibacillus]|uniref:hypothetical protein n=1 Tax=unclassified Paenibacillus TaxID=185978 RepID=UPI002405C8CB|nr:MULTISPECIES: hypothetical protein [unclassified Paenibacillus]MDF9842003.1 hypothetical protein [Paenibacillus sp. PastF-2]MDF9848743.1 hypothetical protein [Paenibacillus sp. PastM-2]MDF9855313.1 hypothetical protein [Paenibacillus sp. PastF-1]MDH6480583.1 hypothetical protein [Paenibacillus sp. PastH-2]MDH6508009.1 hypothetical protein [Paenibacillus sp. PastM-3]